jgi:retron-type reverse transcriptase
VFLDISQAFDRVWHEKLLFKLKKFLPVPYFLLIKFYLSGRSFKVHLKNNYSNSYRISAGVPQGSDIAPFLYAVFTHDIPKTPFTILGTFAADILIATSHQNSAITCRMIQSHLDMINLWTKR